MSTEFDDENNPSDNGRYVGPEVSCRICHKRFIPGDMIYIDSVSEFIFCYMDNEPTMPDAEVKRCHLAWNEVNKSQFIKWEKPLVFTGTVRFHELKNNSSCYFGEKIFCDICGHDFRLGDVIFYLRDKDLIFCYDPKNPGDPKGCFGGWLIRVEPVAAKPDILEYWGKNCFS